MKFNRISFSRLSFNGASLASLAVLSAAVLLVVEPAFADGGVEMNDYKIRCAAAQLITLTEGNLGALIMIVAGIGTIIASAFGAYRAATSLLVVAVGSFVLRSLVMIFFNADLTYYSTCNQGSRTVNGGPADSRATPGGSDTDNAIGTAGVILGTLGAGGLSQEAWGGLSEAAKAGTNWVSGQDGNVYPDSASAGAAAAGGD